MPDVKLYTVPESWAKTAWINKENYQEMYRESVDDPEKFWAKQATEFLTWGTPWQTVCDYDFGKNF